MSLRQLAAQRPVLADFFCAGLQFLITTLILKAGIASNIEPAAGPAALLIAERVGYGFEIALTAYVMFRWSSDSKNRLPTRNAIHAR